MAGDSPVKTMLLNHVHNRRSLAIATLLAFVVASTGAEELSSILPNGPNTVQVVDLAGLTRLLEYGIERELMVFEVFNDVTLYLAQREAEIRISGETLRQAARIYDLGGDRVEALLPVAEIMEVRMGKQSDGERGFLDVTLVRAHAFVLDEPSSPIDEANIELSPNYGFSDVTDRRFGEGYGVSVKRRFFGFKLDNLEIYGTNKIAIHVRGFARPKRWRIHRIVAW